MLASDEGARDDTGPQTTNQAELDPKFEKYLYNFYFELMRTGITEWFDHNSSFSSPSTVAVGAAVQQQQVLAAGPPSCSNACKGPQEKEMVR